MSDDVTDHVLPSQRDPDVRAVLDLLRELVSLGHRPTEVTVGRASVSLLPASTTGAQEARHGSYASRAMATMGRPDGRTER